MNKTGYMRGKGCVSARYFGYVGNLSGRMLVAEKRIKDGVYDN